VQAGEAQFVECLVGADAAEFGGQAGQFFGVAALGDPLGAQGGQAGADVDLGGRVGIGAGAVVNVDRRVLFATESGRRVGLRDFAHRHADVRAGAFDVDLAGIGQRLDCGLVDMGVGGEELFFGVHGGSVRSCNG
jgi:hypothetical protein